MRTYLAFCVTLTCFFLAAPSSALAVTYSNLTTDTVLVADDYEGVSAIGVGFDDDLGTVDYDPVATVGTWVIDETDDSLGEQLEMVQVSDFTGTTTGGAEYPGAIQGSNYMRINRAGDYNAAYGTPDSLQDTNGDMLHVEWMAWVRPGTDNLGILSLYKNLEGTGNRLAALAVQDDGSINGGGSMTYTQGLWQKWEVDYEVGASTFDLSIDGVTETGLAVNTSGGAAGAFRFGSRSGGELLVDAVPAIPELVINRSTGEIRLQNNEAVSISGILGYQMSSPVGALDQAGWKPITGNYDAPANDGNGLFDSNDSWTVLSDPNDHSDLSEVEFDGGDGGALSPGADFDLGAAWLQNPTEDVTFQFLMSNGVILAGEVSYVGDPLQRSDLNFDTFINENDWLLYIAFLEADLSSFSPIEAYQHGDLNYDGLNNDVDFELFRTDFDLANGTGAFAAMLSSIPEPTTATLTLFAVAGLFWRRTLLGQWSLNHNEV